MNLVLANIDYKTHTTDEGEQLQAGLQAAGWTLAGHGYGDGCCHVPTLLDRHQPQRIFVQDCRDWRSDSRGCFNPHVAFEEWAALRCRTQGVTLFTVCKDAGTVIDFQRQFAADIHVDGIVCYYHPRSVCGVAPWLADHNLIRTYHTLNREVCEAIPFDRPRRRCLVSGACSGTIYPLRRLVMDHCHQWVVDFWPHPGYSNQGSAVALYLKLLGGYRVHVACASRYGFALRKIIESVAMGATPVTDLPHYDRLPHIDGALARVRPGATADEVKHTIDTAEEAWNADERLKWALLARTHYDWRVVGRELSENINHD